jgi:hypothetical protein
MDFNIGLITELQASHIKYALLSRILVTKICLQNLGVQNSFQMHSLLQTVLLITSWHGPHGKHPVSNTKFIVTCVFILREPFYRTVAQNLFLYIRESRSHCIAVVVVSLFVSRSLSSNGSVRHCTYHILCSSCHATRTIPVFLVPLFTVI